MNMTIKPWRMIDSRYLIRDRWMTLRADRCQLPSGVVVEPYYVQEPPDWVNVVAFDDENRMLITRQYRHGAQLICAELPSGTVEREELPERAIRREILEETGCAVRTLDLLATLCPNPARYSNKVHVYLATGTRRVQEPVLDETEEIEFSFMTIPEVLSLIDSGGFPQALHIATVFMALRRRQIYPATDPL